MPEIAGGFDIARGGYAHWWMHDICDEKTAALRVLRQLYPGGAVCASCGQPIQGRRALETFWRGDRTWCSSCETKFVPSTGTILAGAHVTYTQFEILKFCYALPHVTDDQRIRIATTLSGLTSDTVKVWFSKIRFWEGAGA